MKNEYLKAIVWPREKAAGVYRYVIVGMLVTDTPMPSLEGRNEVLVDGQTYGEVSKIFDFVRQGKPDRMLGDATDVLLSLTEIGIAEEDGNETPD